MTYISKNNLKNPFITADGINVLLSRLKKIKHSGLTQEHFVILNVKIVISSLVPKMID